MLSAKKLELINLLLGKTFDSEVAKEVGCSRTRIWQLRVERGIAAFKPPKGVVHPRTLKNERILKDFLHKNTDKEISLDFIQRKTGITQYKGKSLNLGILLEFAKLHKIPIKLRRRPNAEFSHGRRAYSKKICACNICRLSNNINTHLRNNGTPIKLRYTDLLANTYINKFTNDKSLKRQIFWRFLEKKAQKYIGK